MEFISTATGKGLRTEQAIAKSAFAPPRLPLSRSRERVASEASRERDFPTHKPLSRLGPSVLGTLSRSRGRGDHPR